MIRHGRAGVWLRVGSETGSVRCGLRGLASDHRPRPIRSTSRLAVAGKGLLVFCQKCGDPSRSGARSVQTPGRIGLIHWVRAWAGSPPPIPPPGGLAHHARCGCGAACPAQSRVARSGWAGPARRDRHRTGARAGFGHPCLHVSTQQPGDRCGRSQSAPSQLP